GEALPPSKLLTGPASPRRSVCAPGTMALSFYRRPTGDSTMGLTSWLRNLKSPWHLGNTAGDGRRASALASATRCRLQLEALEDRFLPSTFTVLNDFDSGSGSLRQAVLDANGHPGADVIDFAPAVSGTILLTSGQLSITDDLRIDGPGASQ